MALRAAAVALVVFVVLGAALFGLDVIARQPGPPQAAGGGQPAASRAAPSRAALPTATATGTGATAAPRVDPASGLLTIARAALPIEARLMLDVIAAGGPFRHAADGAAFRNLEGILPRRATGYYREYTVETPGSPDRGARRIVTGNEGESYWTADHYASFRRILP